MANHKCPYCNEPSPKALRLRRDWSDKPGTKARICDPCYEIIKSEHFNPAMTKEELLKDLKKHPLKGRWV
jgi:hypothetical protein